RVSRWCHGLRRPVRPALRLRRVGVAWVWLRSFGLAGLWLGRFGGGGECLVQLVLSSPELRQFVRAVPWLADAGLGLARLGPGSVDLGGDRLELVWEAVDLAFEATDDLGGV